MKFIEQRTYRSGAPCSSVKEDSSTLNLKDYYVSSKVDRASYEQIDSGMFVSSPLLTFDSKTGILTSATGQFSDVLLNKLGVSFIFGGIFDLLDYSKI